MKTNSKYIINIWEDLSVAEVLTESYGYVYIDVLPSHQRNMKSNYFIDFHTWRTFYFDIFTL